MKKIKITSVFLILALMFITPNILANENLNNAPERVTSNTSPVITDAGVWVVVTNENYPLKDRKIESYIINSDQESVFVDRYVTNQDGVIYTRLKTGYRYKFVDVLTNTETSLQIDQTFPQIVSLSINNTSQGNTSLTVSVKDNVTLQGIPFVIVSAYDTVTGNLVLQERTNENGRLQVNNFREGIYTFVLSARGYNSIRLQNTKILENIENTLNLTLEPLQSNNTFSIKTVIKDKETERAVPFTEVLVYNEKGSVVYKDVSDQTGLLYIQNIEAGTYTFVLSARGYQTNKIREEILKDTSLEFYLESLDVLLPEEQEYGKLKVLVIDSVLERPIPLVNLSVLPDSVRIQESLREQNQVQNNNSVSNTSLNNNYRAVSLQTLVDTSSLPVFNSFLTDEYGVAYFNQIPLNKDMSLRVNVEGYQTYTRNVTFNQEYNSLEIRLVKEGTVQPEMLMIKIQVKDDTQKIIPLVNLELISENSKQRTTTDRYGQAIFENLSSRETYTLIVSKEGYETIKKTDLRFRFDTRLDFNLNRLSQENDVGYLKVLVIDRTTQKPLTNASVNLTGIFEKILYGSAVTDEFGVAYFKNIPLNKNIQITSNYRGYDSFSREVNFKEEYNSFEIRLTKINLENVERDILRQEEYSSSLTGSLNISNIESSRVYKDFEDRKYYEGEEVIEIVDFETILKDRNISEDRVVSEPELVYVNGDLTYVYRIKEQRRLFNFINIGEKVVYNASPAVR